MKITSIKILSKILSLIILAGASLCMSGCATLFPGTGAKRSTSVVEFLYPNKRPFVQPSIPTLSLPMRVGVERYLGAPVLVKQLSVLPSSEEFSDLSHQLRNGDWNYDRRKCAAHVYHGNLADVQKRSQGRESKNGLLQTTTPFLYARYNYEGRLISRDLIGEYFVWGVLTLGIREFVQIPQALWILATDHKRLNYVSVWYDDGGRVVAYAWAWRDFSVPSPAGAQEQKQVDSQELKTFWNLQ